MLFDVLHYVIHWTIGRDVVEQWRGQIKDCAQVCFGAGQLLD